MGYLYAVLLGYLIGTSSMSLYLSLLHKVDLRAGGSGNLGASNTVLLMGWKAGVLVALHDIGKAALAVCLARTLFPQLPYAAAAAGAASVLGHIFPFYLKFRGGKGFASYFGMALALNWRFGVVIFFVALALTFLTDYIVSGTLTVTLTSPVWLGMQQRDWILPAILLIASAVIWYKHRENFVRILNGTEIGLKSAFKGEHRVR